jgi:hypothetical protein
MLTLNTIPLDLYWMAMNERLRAGEDAISGGIGEDADHNVIGKGVQQMNINFDRATNWDEEREELTEKQRIRDLETYVFGDRRGLTIGIMRQMRSHLIWLIVLSLFQFLAVLMQAILIWSILRGLA